jgi:hypothetical protein
MGRAEEYQGEAIERARDAEAVVAANKAEVHKVPVGGKPDIADPGGSQHDREGKH